MASWKLRGKGSATLTLDRQQVHPPKDVAARAAVLEAALEAEAKGLRALIAQARDATRERQAQSFERQAQSFERQALQVTTHMALESRNSAFAPVIELHGLLPCAACGRRGVRLLL